MLDTVDTLQAVAALEQRLTAITADRSAERLHAEMAKGSWIYGAGNYGQRVAGLMRAKGLPCLGFIDQRGATLGTVAGLPAYSPATFPAELAKGRCCVVGVFNEAVEADDILAFTDTLPFAATLWNADIPEAFGPAANSVWLSSRSDLLGNFDLIRKVALSLADRTSLDTLMALVLSRFTGRRDDYPPYDLRTQYMPDGLPGFDRPITFVDGGAYSGDTGIVLRDNGITISNWVAFEPDPANFERLARTVRQAGIPAALFPCGLSDRMHQATFENDQGLGSRISPDGAPPASNTVTIQCAALDDVMPGLRPDFVKLDIEGAEIAALNGMAGIIRASTPRLAICAYHKPHDIWDIPLKMLELLPDVPLYLRQHLSNGFETVYYSIPTANGAGH
jgi:hypothetical protein